MCAYMGVVFCVGVVVCVGKRCACLCGVVVGWMYHCMCGVVMLWLSVSEGMSVCMRCLCMRYAVSAWVGGRLYGLGMWLRVWVWVGGCLCG